MSEILAVHDLKIGYSDSLDTSTFALKGISFAVAAGEVLGILGESGCGKTTLAKALAGTLPGNTKHAMGQIELEGKSVSLNAQKKLNYDRASKIVVIAQEPSASLNPVIAIGNQIAEVFRANNRWDRTRVREETQALLASLGLGDRELYNAYPHQISGGQQQRVAIAQALAARPALLIADEPTASLDAETETSIVKVLKDLVVSRRMALILITHNPGILADFAERALILYAGRVIERGSLREVFETPLHPYTAALLRCMRDPSNSIRPRNGDRFPTIPGSPPKLAAADGCSFVSRCPERLEVCGKQQPPFIQTASEQSVECFLYGN
jgi:oligopeptide/dipeptide ABC transporter ATP-binding protein